MFEKARELLTKAGENITEHYFLSSGAFGGLGGAGFGAWLATITPNFATSPVIMVISATGLFAFCGAALSMTTLGQLGEYLEKRREMAARARASVPEGGTYGQLLAPAAGLVPVVGPAPAAEEAPPKVSLGSSSSDDERVSVEILPDKDLGYSSEEVAAPAPATPEQEDGYDSELERFLSSPSV